MSFVERQRHLLRTGEFSDFILNVGGRDFQVHRSIICPQSTVLHRLCASNFKEGLEGRGTLVEENADIFERVLEFVYTGEYDPSSSEAEVVAGNDIDDSGYQGAPEVNEDETEASSHQSEQLMAAPEINEDEIEAPSQQSEQLMVAPEIKEAGASRHQSERLMIHTEVYLLAKYLDISELMQQATSKFTTVVKENFRADAFIESFARVFNHGSDGDSGLRSQILELCLKNSEHFPQEGDLTQLLLQHEPIAWKMLSRQAHEHAYQVEEAVKTRRVLEGTLQTSQETIENLKQRVEKKATDRDRILTLLEKYNNCRHCQKDFGSYVDEHEFDVIRCKGCRCRHYI